MLELGSRIQTTKPLEQQTESGLYVYSRQLRFPSHRRTYIADMTPHVNMVIREFNERNNRFPTTGTVILESMHTTFGVLKCETAEPGLFEDMIINSLETVPEDIRGTWVTDRKYGCITTDENGFYKYPTTNKYKHDCMANLLRDPDEIDIDFNGGRHNRASTYAHQSVSCFYDAQGTRMGKYNGFGGWEFDGRDGSGVNPERIRTVIVSLKPHDIDKDPNITYIDLTT